MKKSETQRPVKIDKDIFELLKIIKENDGIPMSVSLNRAVVEYAKNKGVK